MGIRGILGGDRLPHHVASYNQDLSSRRPAQCGVGVGVTAGVTAGVAELPAPAGLQALLFCKTVLGFWSTAEKHCIQLMQSVRETVKPTIAPARLVACVIASVCSVILSDRLKMPDL